MKTKLVPFDIEKAKNGAKIVTRSGLSARRVDVDDVNNGHPVLCLVTWKDGIETPILYSIDGRYYPDQTDDRDLFIEEKEVEETNDYDPYKATVESIADMVERYSDVGSDLQDFYDNVKVQCKDAVEYERIWCKKQGEKPADNKPEFQEGDWVIDGLGIVHQIIRVVENLGSHTYGYGTDDGFYIHDSESGVRLWNINDAKDGDVLMKGEVIFIFNKMLGEWIYCHSSISYKDGSSINLNNCGLINNEVYPATKERRDFLFQKMKEAGYKWDPVKKELKKTESEEKKELKKVEPKFQEGDWVVFKQDGNAHQIIRVVENVTSHTYGYDTADDYYFNDTEESVRRWTIQEAKDGNVLCSTGLHNDCIFIFNGLDNWKFDAEGDRAVATGYCCLFITADKMEFGIQGPDCIEVNTIKPATKEQRDLLFQKMKEAGYEWDSVKKELKIEKVKTRRMTHRELAWWLRDKPEEHRELKMSVDDPIIDSLYYYDNETNETVNKDIIIRRNGGEWIEPLIEEMED